MAQLIDLGKIRFDWKGAYNSGTTYELNDVVRYSSNAYIYINTASAAGNAPTDTSRWALLVEGAFPNQTGNDKALLTTNGTTTSWTDTPEVTSLTIVQELTLLGGVETTFRQYDVTDAELVDNVATLTTTAPHYFFVGDTVEVAGLGSGPFNGSKVITGTPTATSFTYSTSGTDTSVTGADGTATVYGNIDSAGTLTVAQAATLNDALTVEGASNLNGSLDVYGDAIFHADLNIKTDLVIEGDVTISAHTHAVVYKRVFENVATLTLQVPSDGHGYDVGDKLNVSGVGAPFDGHYLVITEVTLDTVSYAVTYANMPNQSATGTASVEGHLNLQNELTVGEGATFGDTVSIAGGLTATGNAYIGDGAEAFSTAAELTNPELVVKVDGGPYAQVAIHNATPGASTDLILYPDNGVDAAGWMDLGVTGSAFEQTAFGLTGPNEGYIFFEAPVDTEGTGNMVIATGGNGSENKIVFGAGGFADGQTQMAITPGESVHIEIPTPSTSPTSGALTVVGGVGIAGDMNIQGDVAIEGTITFGGSGTTVETSNLAVTDPAVFVGTNNQSDIVDLAFIGEYATAVSAITKAVTNKALTSNVATLTTSLDHTYLVGDVVVVTGVDSTFNGTHSITSVPNGTTFTYAKTASNVPSAAVTPNGSASVSARRKFAGIARDATDGVVKVFKDATTKPTSTVNFAEAGLSYADVKLNTLTTVADTNVTGALAVTGATTTTGTFTANGAVTLNSTLTTANNVTISGRLDVQEIREDVLDGSIVSNVFTADYSLGNIFYLTASPGANFTINLTNAPTDNGKSMSLTVVVPQGSTGYLPSAFQIAGTGQTLRWASNVTPVPTSINGRIDIFSFTLIRRASAWVVLGAANLNY